MDIAELSAQQVRRDEKLLRQYVEEYTALFGFKPNCVSCTFKRDFAKFKRAKQTKPKFQTMKKTFKLHKKQERVIHTYRENGRPKRVYGHSMTEDFAKNYLTKGTKEQIEERKKYFEQLPGEQKEEKEQTEHEAFADQGVRELSKAVNDITDVEFLQKVAAEKRIRERKSAAKLVEDRIAELQEESEEEDEETTSESKE